MALILSDGRNVEIDLAKVTLREYRSLFDKTQGDQDEAEIIGKAAGLALEDTLSLPYLDYKKLVRAFLDAARQPLADPN